MPGLPKKLEIHFYKTIEGEIALKDFEQWLYENEELPKYVSQDDHLDLIAFNFNQKAARYELWKLLSKHIDLGEFEAYKILNLLYKARLKNDELPEILIQLYYLHYDGYDFLEELGMDFGLTVLVPSRYNRDNFEELTKSQQKELLSSFSPRLEIAIERAIAWLETKKVVPTGTKGEYGRYEFQDFRTPEERKSIYDKSKSAEKPKRKWWQFFK